MKDRISILVIEDEKEIRRFLEVILSGEGYEKKFAESAAEGLQMITLNPPTIIILDLGLPDFDGFEVIKKLRQWSEIPIIVLSARGAEEDKVKALELGANDYLVKPFGAAELLARIKVILRWSQNLKQNLSAVFEVDDLKMDLQNRRVFVGEKEIRLTKIEYKLLSFFVRNAGKVLTHSQILQEVWGKYSIENNHYLRIYTQHLRDKLGDNPLSPKYIFTETGIGYRFKAGD